VPNPVAIAFVILMILGYAVMIVFPSTIRRICNDSRITRWQLVQHGIFVGPTIIFLLFIIYRLARTAQGSTGNPNYAVSVPKPMIFVFIILMILVLGGMIVFPSTIRRIGKEPQISGWKLVQLRIINALVIIFLLLILYRLAQI
jgi:hypothetical protein